jgi:hypothetical protein
MRCFGGLAGFWTRHNSAPESIQASASSQCARSSLSNGSIEVTSSRMALRIVQLALTRSRPPTCGSILLRFCGIRRLAASYHVQLEPLRDRPSIAVPGYTAGIPSFTFRVPVRMLALAISSKFRVTRAIALARPLSTRIRTFASE